MIEEPFNSKRDGWVKSSVWEQAARIDHYHEICSLPYCTSSGLTDPNELVSSTALIPWEPPECVTCSQHHKATKKIKLFGIPYDPDKLQTFKPETAFQKDADYHSSELLVGDLCHSRIRLFHAMKHFKFHLLVSLRKLLSMLEAKPGALDYNTRIVQNMFKENNRPNEKDNGFASISPTASSPSAVSPDLCSRLTRRFIADQYSVYERLLELSDSYTATDTRKVHIDVYYLNQIQQFEEEACATQLFSLREPNDSSSSTPDADPAHSSVPPPDRGRCLLMNQVAKTATSNDLLYLYNQLSEQQQRWWRKIATEQANNKHNHNYNGS